MLVRKRIFGVVSSAIIMTKRRVNISCRIGFPPYSVALRLPRVTSKPYFDSYCLPDASRMTSNRTESLHNCLMYTTTRSLYYISRICQKVISDHKESLCSGLATSKSHFAAVLQSVLAQGRDFDCM